MPATRYTEAIPFLYTTTLVFETPREFHSFRLVASPDGLASIRGVIIAYGRVDWTNVGSLYFQHARNNQASLTQWEEALQDLSKLSSLRELQIFLYHRNRDSEGKENGVQVADAARRPWNKDVDDTELEMRHSLFFDMFAKVRKGSYYDKELDSWCVPDFTLNLSWYPKEHEMPFSINHMSSDEIRDAIDGLPEKTELDLYE
jgi:hypothetical protein